MFIYILLSMNIYIFIIYIFINIYIYKYVCSLCLLFLVLSICSILYFKFMSTVLELFLFLGTSCNFLFAMLYTHIMPFYIFMILWFLNCLFINKLMDCFYINRSYVTSIYVFLAYTIFYSYILSDIVQITNLVYIYMELNFCILLLFSVFFIIFRQLIVCIFEDSRIYVCAIRLVVLHIYAMNVGFLYLYVLALNIHGLDISFVLTKLYSILEPVVLINLASYIYIIILMRAILLLHSVYYIEDVDFNICVHIDFILSTIVKFDVHVFSIIYKFSPAIFVILSMCICRCILFDLLLGFYPNIVLTILLVFLILLDKFLIRNTYFLLIFIYLVYVALIFLINIELFESVLHFIVSLNSFNCSYTFLFVCTPFSKVCMNYDHLLFSETIRKAELLLSKFKLIHSSNSDICKLLCDIYYCRTELAVYTGTNLSDLCFITSNFLVGYRFYNSIETPLCVTTVVSAGTCDCSVGPCCKNIGFSHIRDKYCLFYKEVYNYHYKLGDLYFKLVDSSLYSISPHIDSDGVLRGLLSKVFKVIDIHVYADSYIFLNYNFSEVLVFVITDYLDSSLITSVKHILNVKYNNFNNIFKFSRLSALFILSTYLDIFAVRYKFLKTYSDLSLFQFYNILDNMGCLFNHYMRFHAVCVESIILFTGIFLNLISILSHNVLFICRISKFYKFISGSGLYNLVMLNYNIYDILEHYFCDLKCQFFTGDVIVDAVYFRKFKSLLFLLTLAGIIPRVKGNYSFSDHLGESYSSFFIDF